MKKLFIIFTILLSLIFAIPAFAIDVTINGNALAFDVQPTSINGRTMVPLRAIFEALGATVQWEGTTRTITATKGDTVIVLQLDNPAATVKGNRVTLDVPATSINNRTMVPTRFIAESLGAKVNWNGATSTVQILAALPNMDFELKTGEFKDGNFIATGIFKNIGNVKITQVDYVDIKLYLAKNTGAQWEAANQRFSNITADLAPGESGSCTFLFQNVPYNADVTTWDSDEYYWEFTYVDDITSSTSAPTPTPVVTTQPSMSFELTTGEYQGNNFVANGTFKNTGNVKITKVDKVDIKLYMYGSDQTTPVLVADQSFVNIPVNLTPGQSDSYSFIFSNVPVYSDVTAWNSDEYDWIFTYEG